jgi:hypothetical protein
MHSSVFFGFFGVFKIAKGIPPELESLMATTGIVIARLFASSQ